MLQNPGDQAAADKFHQLTIAFELLSDPTKRATFDTSRAAKLARAARFANLDSKRKAAVEDLAARENEFKRQRTEEGKKQTDKARKLEEIRAASAQLRKAKEAALASEQTTSRPTGFATRAEENVGKVPSKPAPSYDTPSLEDLSDPGGTLRVKWSRKREPSLLTADDLTSRILALDVVGSSDIESVLVSKDPTSKKGSAIVVLRRRGKAEELVKVTQQDAGWEHVQVSVVMQ